jgi:glycerophosphoryl diester phosphodiesterase
VDKLRNLLLNIELANQKSSDLETMSPSRPRVLAHRGASGHCHENSLAAFREARRLGCDGVELDIHASADGALVVHHDVEIPGLGPIPAHPLEAIRRIRVGGGESVPTLAEALDTLGDLEVWVELKSLPPSVDDLLLAALDGGPAPERYGVHGFDHRIVARLGAKRPGLRRGILSASYPLDPVGPMAAAGANTLWQVWHLIDAELVRAVHRKNSQLIAWTVNEAADARRLGALGVDALCGNFPERLRWP